MSPPPITNHTNLTPLPTRYHSNVAAIKQFYREISVTVDGEGPSGTAFKDNVSRVSRELFQGIDNQRYGSPKIIIAGAPGGGKGERHLLFSFKLVRRLIISRPQALSASSSPRLTASCTSAPATFCASR